MSEEYRPVNQEKDEAYNAKPGIVVVPGSKLAQEMVKFEQFPSKWGANPGNPYVYRPFPKMVYKAQKINGKPFVMLPEPRRYDFSNRDEFKSAIERKNEFDAACQRVVNDERELQRAYEAGWRSTPQEAIDHIDAVDRGISNATAEREYADQFVSEPAKREIQAAKEAAGNEHLPEIKEKPIRRRGRPKGSKNKPRE